MTKIDQNLLIDHEWTGTFFPPGHPELSFGGKLIYSPTAGLCLEYARPYGIDVKQAWNYLLGHTSTGVALTLVGKFSSERAGLKIKHGVQYWTSTGHPFFYVLFGYHFDDKIKFDEFGFDISGAEEFFVPAGRKSHIKFSRSPVFTARTDVGEVSAYLNGSFQLIGGDVSGVLYDRNEVALNELQSAYAEIKARHSSFYPMLRKTLDYWFSFKSKQDISITDAYKTCESVANLFSVLFFGPARLTKFTALAKDQEGDPHSLEIFPAKLSDKGALEQALQERSYFYLPLNSRDIDIAALLPAWLRSGERFSTIVSTLQGSTGLISEHEILASIVLSVAQLEGMAKEAGKNGNREKFQHGIDHHASEKVRAKLKHLLNSEGDELGAAISDVRNEIAHMGRPKKYLDTLDFGKRYAVSLALEAVVAGYALDQIGVAKHARDKYQDTLIAQA